MFHLVFKRILIGIPAFLFMIIVTSTLIHLIPGDPVEKIAGEYASKEQKEKIRQNLGLDKPVANQIIHYTQQLIKGDLGNSLISGKKVSMLIRTHILSSLELALGATILALCISLILGILAAVKQDGITDVIINILSLVGNSAPSFLLATFLILFFSIKLDLLPVSGNNSLKHFLLPLFTLTFSFCGILIRMVRASILEQYNKDYVRTARSKGLDEKTILFQHILKNASIPIVSLIGIQFGAVLTGTIVTEKIFDWPGIGTLLIESIVNRDYILLQGVVLTITLLNFCVNILTDIAYALLDPRINVNEM